MELAIINSKYYCGVNLHNKSMYLCITNKDGKILLQKRLRNDFEELKKSTKKYINHMAVGVESTHNYYWFYDA